MEKNEIILFAPLNWGLGHATRLVPLINDSLKQGSTIIIAANGASLKFMELEFPDLKVIKLAGYRVRYAKPPYFLPFLLLQMPFFYFSILIEHYTLKKLIRKYQISTIISDNRYGLWNRKVKSILITHQVFIKLPKPTKFLEPILHKITHKLIKQFHECWIPDYESLYDSLSGKLSHGSPLPNNVKYIGPLSRFQNVKSHHAEQKPEVYDVLVIISGPEPHRTHFESEMEQRFINSNQRVLMVCGKPGRADVNRTNEIKNITKVEHLSTTLLYYYMTHSKHIISRSGYSTIMDLHTLNLSAELIPTPGQTEQEYLAEWWKETKRE